MDAALAKRADRARQQLVNLDENEVWVPERCRARHKPAGQICRSDLQLTGTESGNRACVRVRCGCGRRGHRVDQPR